MTKEQAIKKFEELVNDFDFKAKAMKQAYPNTIILEHTDATFIETLERQGKVNVWHYEWVDRPESFSLLTPSNKVQSKRRLTEWELTQYVLQIEGEYERLLPEIELHIS